MFESHSRPPLTIACLMNEFPVVSETVIGVQIRALERLGHRVLPVAVSRPGGSAQPDDTFAERALYLCDRRPWSISDLVHIMPGRWSRAMGFLREQKTMSRWSLLYHGWRLANLLRRERVDHLQVQFAWEALSYGIVASKLAGCGVSFVGHGADVYLAPADLSAKLRHVDIAFASCSTMAADFRRLAPEARIERIAMGIELDRVPQPKALAPAGPDFLFVGRMVEKKGLDVLLDAISSLPADRRPSIDIVGEGPLGPKVQNRILEEKLEDSVRLLGYRDPAWVFDHIPYYHAVVVPCVPARNGDRDTGPRIAKEAMALGVPVIASDFMGLADLVDARCGLPFATASSEALAAALSEAQNWSPERRRELGTAGREKVETEFNADFQARRMAGLIAAA